MKTRKMPRVYVLYLLKDCGGGEVPRVQDTTRNREYAELWYATREQACGCVREVYVYACDRVFAPRKRKKEVSSV